LVHGLLSAKDECDWLTDEHVNGMLVDLINTGTLYNLIHKRIT